MTSSLETRPARSTTRSRSSTSRAIMVDHRTAAESTLAFHETTKHTVHSVRGGTHVLDATNMPRPWKLYDLDLPTTPLPDSLTRSGTAVQDVLLGSNDFEDDAIGPTLTQLASVLQLSAGVTRQLRLGEFRMNFRAAACTGALYHIEIYVICGPLEGLPAGVYHYGVHDNALRQLRDGDFRAAVARAHDAEDRAPLVTIAYTSTFWRNAWKYQERAYRHSFWDAGTILANSLAAAQANGLIKAHCHQGRHSATHHHHNMNHQQDQTEKGQVIKPRSMQADPREEGRASHEQKAPHHEDVGFGHCDAQPAQ